MSEFNTKQCLNHRNVANIPVNPANIPGNPGNLLKSLLNSLERLFNSLEPLFNSLERPASSLERVFNSLRRSANRLERDAGSLKKPAGPPELPPLISSRLVLPRSKTTSEFSLLSAHQNRPSLNHPILGVFKIGHFHEHARAFLVDIRVCFSYSICCVSFPV